MNNGQKALPHVRLMTRRECCLCDDAKAVIVALADQGLCSWEPVNVDRDKALLVRYGMDVPVLLIDDQQAFMHRVSETDLRSALEKAALEKAVPESAVQGLVA